MSTITIRGTVARPKRAISWGRYALIALATTLAATAATTLVYYLGSALVDYHARFDLLASVTPTIAATLEAGVIASLLYAGLLRFSGNPTRTFTIIAAVVFVVTLIPDIVWVPTMPGSSAAQTATLMLMHVVGALVITPLLTTYASPAALAAPRRPQATR